jgi:hypothetical protein
MDGDQSTLSRRCVTVSITEATTSCSDLPQSRHLKNKVLCRWSIGWRAISTIFVLQTGHGVDSTMHGLMH